MKLFPKTPKTVPSFTLIETLLAILIISMAILGPLSVSITASSYSRDTKNLIIATYLAHEGLELVRFKRDSIFVECQSGDPACTIDSFNSSMAENTEQAAWRNFKESMGSNGWALGAQNVSQPPCFVDQNSEGCAFDVYGITSTGAGVGTRYLADSDDSCSSLYIDNRKDKGISGTGSGVTDYVYLCKINGLSYGYSDTGFKRVIKMTSIALPYGDDYEKMYEDDVRVESAVTYSRSSGFTRTVRVVDYLHARP